MSRSRPAHPAARARVEPGAVSGATTAPHQRTVLAILLAYLALAVFRSRAFILEGRLMAEEAFVYLQSGLDHGIPSLLLRMESGQYCLTGNIGAVLALMLPLEYAPLAPMLLSLLVQLGVLGVILLLAQQVAPGDTRLHWLLAAVYVAGASTGGVWMASVLSGFHLGIAAAVISVSRSPTAGHRWFYRLMLGVGALAGPITCFMLPVLAGQFLRSRCRERLVQLAVVAAGAGVQLTAMLTSNTADRDLEIGMLTLAGGLLTKGILMPQMGSSLANVVSMLYRDVEAVPMDAWLRRRILHVSQLPEFAFDAALLVCVLVALALFFAAVVYVWKRAPDEGRVLLVCAVYVLTVSLVGSREPKDALLRGLQGSRYGAAPNTMLAISVALALWRGGGRRVSRRTAAIFLGAFLVAGFGTFLYPVPGLQADGPGASWRDEVARYRETGDTLLQVAPPEFRMLFYLDLAEGWPGDAAAPPHHGPIRVVQEMQPEDFSGSDPASGCTGKLAHCCSACSPRKFPGMGAAVRLCRGGFYESATPCDDVDHCPIDRCFFPSYGSEQ